MDLTTALTGGLIAIMLVAAPLTAVTSALLLWLFRRATLRGMAQSTGTVEPPLKQPDRRRLAAAGYAPLTIISQQPGTVYSSADGTAGVSPRSRCGPQRLCTGLAGWSTP